MEPVEITAGRLHLRPWTEYDEDALFALFTDEQTVRWSSTPHPFTRAEARRRLTEMFPATWADGTGATFAVVDAVSAEVLAWVALFGIAHRGAEIGWATMPAARGGGVSSQAVAAVCRWAFASLDLQVITAGIAVGNWASRAVAAKCGFTVEGTGRLAMPQRGERRDCWNASLLATDEITDRRPLPSPPVLTDGVVTLRAFGSEDAPDVQRACEDPVSARWLPALPSPYTLEDGRVYVEQVCQTGWAEGTQANFAVVDAGTGELLGNVGLKLGHRELGYDEVGYWTAPWARGRGVAGRGSALVARWGLQELGLNRVELLADIENTASVRAAEKAGFVREGVARAARADRYGVPHDMVLFSRTKNDRAD